MDPMTANWKRCLGLQSTLAPMSRTMQEPSNVGKRVAMAGRESPVPAHGVQRDAAAHNEAGAVAGPLFSLVLVFLDLGGKDQLALVVAAGGADPVGHDGGAALGALGEGPHLQLPVVGAAAVAP